LRKIVKRVNKITSLLYHMCLLFSTVPVKILTISNESKTRLAVGGDMEERISPIDTYCDVGYNVDRYSYPFRENPNENYPNDD